MSTSHGRPRRRPSVVAAVTVVLAAVGLVASLPDARRADVPTAAATAEPVDRTVLVCPSGRADARVRAASAEGLPATGQSPVDITVDEQGEESRTVTVERGGLASIAVGERTVQVSGTGGAARGLLASRGERSGGTLAAAGCVAPRPEWWIAGAGGGIDHSSVLLLTNVDEGPAVVDVRLHGATGNVDEAGTRGITLGRGESRRFPLAELAPGSDELTVEVSAARGRVAAHVLDTFVRGGRQGREWLPAGAPPAQEVVLLGVAAAADRTQLVVTNPGEQQALVDLQLLTETGSFVPLGTEQLSVRPGAVRRVDLTDALDGRAAGLRLRSEVPVVGTVRSSSGGDVAYAGSVAPVTEPVGVVLVGERSAVQVAAGEEPVSLQLSIRDREGRELLGRVVDVPPSGLVRVRAPAGADHAQLVPRSGGGYAAAVHVRPGLAGQPFTPLPSTVLRAVVMPWSGEDDR